MGTTNWALMVVQLISTAIVGTIGFFLKRELNKSDRFMQKLSGLETKIAEEYVRKDDYNRVNGEILAKVDKIYDMLYELRGGK